MSDLKRITIERDGNQWRVTREQKETGECALVADLGEALRFVLAVYDRNGKLREEFLPKPSVDHH